MRFVVPRRNRRQGSQGSETARISGRVWVPSESACANSAPGGREPHPPGWGADHRAPRTSIICRVCTANAIPSRQGLEAFVFQEHAPSDARRYSTSFIQYHVWLQCDMADLALHRHQQQQMLAHVAEEASTGLSSGAGLSSTVGRAQLANLNTSDVELIRRTTFPTNIIIVKGQHCAHERA